MSLTSLRRSDHKSRTAILADAANLLLPDPSADSLHFKYDLTGKVLEEISNKVPVSRSNEFASSLKQKLITKELRDNILAGANIRNIRDRIGQKGLLSQSLYEVSFRQQFLKLNVQMGVSKALAERTILHPSKVEHLFIEEKGISGLDENSLFTGPVQGRSDCCVVILAIRHNAKLSIDGGWIVFFEDVGIDSSASPVEVLKAFANTYGCITTAGKTKEKFILLETFNLEPHESKGRVFFETGGKPSDVRTSFAISHGILKVALAFAIDLISYTTDLKKRGIDVTRVIPKSSESMTF